jgi:hypothetical protein
MNYQKCNHLFQILIDPLTAMPLFRTQRDPQHPDLSHQSDPTSRHHCPPHRHARHYHHQGRDAISHV